MSTIKQAKARSEVKMQSTRKVTLKARRKKTVSGKKIKKKVCTRPLTPDPETFDTAFSLLSKPDTVRTPKPVIRAVSIPKSPLSYLARAKRLLLWYSLGKHCWYCGMPVKFEDMQVDHIKPLCRGARDIPGIRDHPKYKDRIGEHEDDNLACSCARCNQMKGKLTVEEFRKVFEKKYRYLSRNNKDFKALNDYGLIQASNQFKVKFFFEKLL